MAGTAMIHTGETPVLPSTGSFQTIEELRQVKGIGEAKLAKIRPYVKL